MHFVMSNALQADGSVWLWETRCAQMNCSLLWAYEQICDGYKALILKKVMLPNDPMPSVRSLAVDLSTNPNTVQRAFSELERQGFIYTVKGKGSFVNGDASLRENKKKELVSRLVLWMKEAGELGFDADQLYQAALDMKTGSSGGMVQ